MPSLYLDSLIVTASWFLSPRVSLRHYPQSTKLTQPESRAKHTDFTILCQPCPWHICVDDTSNDAINSYVILLLPYYQAKNQQLTPLWTLSLFQRTELWVVPDDNSARKQWVENWERIWWIRTVSTIRNGHISEFWAYSNGQNCGMLLMMIPRENRGWGIRRGFGQSIITVSKINNWLLSELWAYSNGQNCGLCLMIIPRENKGWDIGRCFRR